MILSPERLVGWKIISCQGKLLVPSAPCRQMNFSGLRFEAESPGEGEAVPRLDIASLYDTRIYYLVQLTGGQKENNNPLCFVK